MRKKIKKIFLLFLGVITLAVLWYWELLLYSIRQGYGQLKIIWQAQPIEKVLHDSSTNDTLKQKLRLIQDIKQFAEKELGLKSTQNYTTFYDQKGKPLLWVVTACLPYELVPYEWEFGLLGKFSYKGHFNRKYAEKDSTELAQQGYDVDISQVKAWSTLGYFNDPILSSMLLLSKGELAELIIHELTHSTIYLKDSVDFNENLASFVGKKGAIEFLKKKFGENSPELVSYRNQLYDDSLYVQFMLHATQSLKNFYAKDTFQKQADTIKRKLKQEFIKKILDSLQYVPFKDRTYDYSSLKKMNPNNTFFMWYVRYNSKESELNRIYNLRFNASLKDFIANFVK